MQRVSLPQPNRKTNTKHDLCVDLLADNGLQGLRVIVNDGR